MHPDQVEITASTVEALLRSQFPQWAGQPVVAVRSHGTVNALFRIGDDLVARFPIEPGDPVDQRSGIEAEMDAARRLRAVAPCPTPEPVALGEPGEGFPLPWSVYRWLPGTIASDAEVADSPSYAVDLGRFVLALRAVPTRGRTFSRPGRGGLLTAHDEYVAESLDRSRGMIDVAGLVRVWADVRTTPRTEPDTWTHGDLMPGNLLAEHGRLTGVIDVGQFDVADPALDLQPAWNLFGPAARAAFRATIGCDDDEWQRGRGWALAQAIGCLWYYRETNPVMSRTAHHTLTAVLTAD